jgi:hypothetical protein
MSTNERICEFLEEKGINVETLTSCPITARSKTPIIYTCSCGENQMVKSNFRQLKKRWLCEDCEPKNKTGKKPPPLNNFIEMLENEGYSLVDPKNSGYKNTKSSVEVYDCEGNIYTTTYNRFQSGFRSPHIRIKPMKLTIDTVKQRVISAGFFWIEGTEYKNDRTPFSVKCHCENIFDVKLVNLHENRVGCPECYRFLPWEYIKDMAEGYRCTLISNESIYEGRDTIIEIFCVCGEEIIKSVRNFIKFPRCYECSVKKRENTNEEKYGHRNYFGSELGKETIKNYYLGKHGVTHNMQIEKTQRKAQETCLKNHGVKCVLSTKEVRDKAIEAHIEKWGAPPGCVEEIRDKMKLTNQKNLGEDYPFQSTEIHKKSRKTCLEKYGNELYIHSETGKKAMVKKYGCEYPMQCPEIFEKAQKSAHARKKYTFPSGNICYVQGYEWMYLDKLMKENYPEENIITGASNVPKVEYNFDGKLRRYFMDMYLDYLRTGIEVKSTWTYKQEIEKNRAKWLAASKLDNMKEFIICVFDAKGIVFEQHLCNGELLGKTMYRKKSSICALEFIPAKNNDDWHVND